jgi:hypothetical protein
MHLRGVNMKPIKSLLPLAGMLSLSGVAVAHGQHAAVPVDSLLHLLTHNWPLLLAAIGIGGALLLRRHPG